MENINEIETKIQEEINNPDISKDLIDDSDYILGEEEI